MIVYLSGPMTGLPEYNYPAFGAAAARLRAEGFTVTNPAENHDGRTDLPLVDYLRLDLVQVCDADVVAVLPGWQQSKGAMLEVTLARMLDMPVLDVETMEPIEPVYETATQEAQRLVHGNRGEDYGHPADDFGRTGVMWGALLEGWRDSRESDVPAELVGLCMIAVKLSREVNRPKRDNRVDIAGYAETVEMIHRRRARTDASPLAQVRKSMDVSGGD